MLIPPHLQVCVYNRKDDVYTPDAKCCAPGIADIVDSINLFDETSERRSFQDLLEFEVEQGDVAARENE